MIAATAAVSARRMRGPRLTARADGIDFIASISSGAKPPSGPIRIDVGVPVEKRLRAEKMSGLSRVSLQKINSAIRPTRQQVAQFCRFLQVWHGQAVALLGGLDHVSGEARQIEAFRIRIASEDGLDAATA